MEAERRLVPREMREKCRGRVSRHPWGVEPAPRRSRIPFSVCGSLSKIWQKSPLKAPMPALAGRVLF